MLNTSRYLNLIAFTWIASVLWCLGGVYLFIVSDKSWTIGELGDFFGGGLGGLAIIALIYTASLQREQQAM